MTSDISVLQFQFVNSYLSLFYIGFYLKDMERLKEVRRAHVSPEVAPHTLIFITTCLREHLFLHLYITHILLEFNRRQNMSNLQRRVGQKQSFHSCEDVRFREAAAAALNAGVIKMTIYYIIPHREI